MSEEPIPKDKFDFDAIDRARRIGFPTLNPLIPRYLEWLQDPNWPVFHSVVELLADAGPALLPSIRAVFVSNDAEWTAAVLTHLCPRLPSDIQARLAPDIAALKDRS